jgi:soluble lytic murein transglycosylase
MNQLLTLLLLLLPSATVEAAWASQGRPGPVVAHMLGQAPPGWSRAEVDARMTSLHVSLPELARARKLWQEGKLLRAVKELERVLAGDLPPELRPQVAFLLARLQQEAGNDADAAKGYARCAADLPLLAPWCAFLEGEAFLRQQLYAEAAAAFARVGGEHVRGRQALELKCIASYRGKDFAAFEQCAAEYGKRHRPTGTLLVLQARRDLDADRKEAAAARVREIRVRMPASGAAKDVEGVAEKLEKEGLKDRLELSPEERFERAEAFYRAYRYAQAIRLADKLVDDSQEKSEIWCRALGLEAVAWARQREQTRSMPFFERFVTSCKPYYTPEILYRGVDAAQKAGKLAFAEQWAPLLADTFPESSLCDDGLLFLARAYDREGKSREMEATLEAILKRFPAGDMVPDAAWLLVWTRYREGKLDEALAAARKLAPEMPARADYRSDGRLQYWAGRILQRQKKKAEARAEYEAVLERYPLSWYGLLSWMRLEKMKKGRGDAALAKARAAATETVPNLDEVLARAGERDLPLERAFLLLRLEQWEEARDELDAVLAGDDSSIHARLLAAFLYDRAGRYTLAHHLLRRKVPDYRYAWPREKDLRWWDVAYPFPYEELVREQGKAEKVPWSLVIAIIREESGFDPAIESYAHALGLMQLLQKTASWVAGKPISRRRLRIPEENVPLGTRYLRYLLDKFKHPALAVAGYNSGPGGVYKTLKRTRTREVDEFVEHIPYDQTRRYTKRVLSSAWSYQFLHGDAGGVIPFELRFPKQK